jgi:hypothetical protein
MPYFVNIPQSDKEGSHYIGHTFDLSKKTDDQGRTACRNGQAKDNASFGSIWLWDGTQHTKTASRNPKIQSQNSA